MEADTRSAGSGLTQRILYGAPPFAPLLFADLAVLAGMGVWDLSVKASQAR